MKRPQLRDIPARTIAEKLAPKIIEQLDWKDDLDEVIADLAKVIKDKGCSSGYSLLKCLDDMGWHVHGGQADELVEELGTAYDIRRELHAEAVRKWAGWNNLKPAFPLDGPVAVNVRGEQHQGEIARIDPRMGTYTVRIPALGHVKEGPGTLGLVFNFEDVQPGASESQAV